MCLVERSAGIIWYGICDVSFRQIKIRFVTAKILSPFVVYVQTL